MRFLFLSVLSAFAIELPAQLVTPACVHGVGIKFLLDAYLASIGACNCERSGVLLTEFPNCETGPFVLAFEDNFDGDSLDKTKWESPGAPGALIGAQILEVNTLENAIVFDGICHLTAKKETVQKKSVNWKSNNEILQDGLPNFRTYNYTGGFIKSKKKFLYGKYEIRCRMPKGNGFWPAFWTFGGQRWNEIDFFDNYAGLNEFVTSIGHDFDGIKKANGCNYTQKGYDFSQWHTFTCIFDYDRMTLMIDGKTVREIYRVVSIDGKPLFCGDEIDYGTYYQLKAYPIEPMSINISMSLISKNGPANSTPTDNTTPFPSSFDVDYIRFWQRAESAFEVYPNPTSGNMIISGGNNLISHVNILNIYGETVGSMVLNSTQVQLDLSTLVDGIYFFEINYNGGFLTKKILKYSSN